MFEKQQKSGVAGRKGVKIMLHDTKCSGAKAYLAFTEEFLSKQPKGVVKHG